MRPDFGTLLGGVLAVGGIGWGMSLEGGSVHEILQPTAALIVLGGTAGATLISQPISISLRALRSALKLVLEPSTRPERDVDLLAELAAEARRGGILEIENRVMTVQNPFLRTSLQMGVDGASVHEIREAMEARIEADLQRREAEAGVFEAAGGFAPTVGILGAVLGLIQVMKHLEDIDEVGKGIAVAFVATIYGVGVANLLLLPAAKKIALRAEAEAQNRTMLLEGAIRVIEGRNPRMIRARLAAYVGDASARGDAEAKRPAALESA